MPFGDNPRAGKVNPHNGARVRTDGELFDDVQDFVDTVADASSESAARFLRALGLL